MFDKDWRNATRFRELLKHIHAYLKNEIVVFNIIHQIVHLVITWHISDIGVLILICNFKMLVSQRKNTN